MNIWVITPLTLLFMIIVVVKLERQNHIFRRILVEDRIDTHLNKPFTIKKYEKTTKLDFVPYLMKTTSGLNKDIFSKFENFYKTKSMDLDYDQPEVLHIVFLNKVEAYVDDTNRKSYDLILKNDPLLFTIDDREDINIVESLINLKYNELEELNINGVITLNGRKHFLSDLTSISSYKNTVGEKKEICSDLVFNFGSVVESVRFDTFKDSMEYLFHTEESDIRLIEKIANTSFIREKRKV